MDRESQIRPTAERKACEDLLDDIRDVLADREEDLKTYSGGPPQRAALQELEQIGKRIAQLAERRGLRWGPEEAFLDGFEDLADTEVDPDQAIPYRLTDGGAE